jgi:hypothetical protein
VAGADGASTTESGRAEWWRGVLVDEGEMEEIVLCLTLRGDQAAATWGGGHRRRMVTAASPHAVSRPRARLTGASRLSGCCGWQVARALFWFFKIFTLPNFEIQIIDLPDVQIHQILHRDSWKHKEQLFFLAQLQIPSEFQVNFFETNLNLNLTWILKGFKHFWKIW